MMMSVNIVTRLTSAYFLATHRAFSCMNRPTNYSVTVLPYLHLFNDGLPTSLYIYIYSRSDGG